MNPLILHIAIFTLTRTVTNTMLRMVYPFLAVLGRGLGVPLPFMSLALTIRAFTGVLTPFIANLADSHGRKLGMQFGLGMFIMGAALVGVWPAYIPFILALVLTMLGRFTFDSAVLAYLGDQVVYSRRGLVIALTEFGWALSFIIGVPLAGFLIERYGWQSPFPVITLLSAVLLIVLSRLLPRDLPARSQQTGLWHNLRTLLNSRLALAGLLVGASMACANEVVNLVFGLWMEDSFGLKIAALAAASAIIGLSELGGEGLTAAMADRLGIHRSVGMGLLANCASALALPFLGRTLPGALVGLFLFYITFEFTIVCSISLLTGLLPEARATLMSTNMACLLLGRAFGALLGGPLYNYSILANCLFTLFFNLVSLVALKQVKAMQRVSLPAQKV